MGAKFPTHGLDGKWVRLKLEQILTTSFRDVITAAKREGIGHRVAALMLGIKRVAETKLLRGLFP